MDEIELNNIINDINNINSKRHNTLMGYILAMISVFILTSVAEIIILSYASRSIFYYILAIEVIGFIALSIWIIVVYTKTKKQLKELNTKQKEYIQNYQKEKENG